jgi:serine/threonine protein kinase
MKYKDLKPDKKVGNYAWNHQALLGSGAFGKVYLGKDPTGSLVAIKTMNNDQITDPYMQEALQKEIKVMQTLKGPNVVRLFDVFKSQSHTYLIQEFCNGGDFRGFLTKKGKLPEADARKVLNDFLNGFSELIKNNFIHRDLKPENMLMNDGSIKIADFGFATQTSQNQMLKTCVGTPLYMSPQILSHKPYTAKSDVWSTGLIYYEMLCGKTPWPARDQLDLIQNIASMPVKYPFNIQISDLSKDFIKGCLGKDEKERFSWEEVLTHKIFTPQGVEAVAVAQLKKKNTVQLDNRSMEVLLELQEIVTKHNVDLEKVFKNFDKSGDQNLDINEFTKMIQVINNTLKADEVQEIFRRFDTDNSNSISLKEFKVLILENDYKLASDNVMLANYRGDKLFNHLINVIHDNHINLEKVFTSLGHGAAAKVLDLTQFKAFVKQIDDQINENDARYIFKKFDQDGSGTISMEEFVKTVEVESKKIINQSNPSNPQSQIAQHKPVPPPNKGSSTAQKIIFELKNIIHTNGLDLGMIFQSFDLSGDSSLDINEFRKLIEVINARYTELEVKDVFSVFDVNGDGDISFKEFEALLK